MAKIIGLNEHGKPASVPPKPTIDQSTPLECGNCGDDVFIPGMKFRKMSKLLTGQAKDGIIPIEIYVCGNCGEINQDLLPDEIKSLYK